MGRTYAPNAIIIGILIGVVVALKVNVVLGVIAALAVSILGWVLIRAFENAVYKAGNAAEDAIRKKLNERKGKK